MDWETLKDSIDKEGLELSKEELEQLKFSNELTSLITDLVQKTIFAMFMKRESSGTPVEINKFELLKDIFNSEYFQSIPKENHKAWEEHILMVASGYIKGMNNSKVLIKTDIKTDVKKESGCFIATVTYGSLDSNEVIILRKWRDKFLLKTILGKIFTKSYYLISPSIVFFIKKSNTLKSISKIILDYFVEKLNNRYSEK